MNGQQNQGFTLIELLVVLAIIGILAATLLPNMLNARKAAQDGAARTFLRHCVTAVEITRDQQGYIANVSQCDDPILGQALPSTVTSTKITPNPTLSDYTISVTSITGKIFKYENGQFTQGS